MSFAITYRSLKPRQIAKYYVTDVRSSTASAKRVALLIGHKDWQQQQRRARGKQLGRKNKTGAEPEQTEPCLGPVRLAVCAALPLLPLPLLVPLLLISSSSSAEAAHGTESHRRRVLKARQRLESSSRRRCYRLTQQQQLFSARPTLLDSTLTTLSHALPRSTTHESCLHPPPLAADLLDSLLPLPSAGLGICLSWRRSRSSSPRQLPA